MDYFSEGERAWQRRFAGWRDRRLRGLTAGADRIGLTPNMLTATGVVCLGVGALIGPRMPVVATVLLLLYVLFDGLDGALARAQGRSHAGGALVDMAADQMGPVVIAAAAAHWLAVAPAVAVLFAGSYLYMITLTVLANNRGVALPPLVRVKYFLYLGFVVLLFAPAPWQPGLTWFMGVATVYQAGVSWILIRRLYRGFDGG